jgi:hypothetical protein
MAKKVVVGEKIESKNRALALEAFEPCSTSAIMRPRNDSGRLTTFNTALISRLVARVCSLSSRALHLH